MDSGRQAHGRNGSGQRRAGDRWEEVDGRNGMKAAGQRTIRKEGRKEAMDDGYGTGKSER